MIIKYNGKECYVPDMPPCNYNKGVDCPKAERHCSTCGWCPTVEEKRRKQVEDKYATIKIGF